MLNKNRINIRIKFLPYLTASIILFLLSLLYFIYINEYTVESFNSFGIPREYNNYTTIIQKRYFEKNNSKKFEELLANKKISTSFTADSDSLGAIAIPRTFFKGVSSDIILFKFKEKSNKKWYFQNNYSVNQFHDNVLFQFGIPIIKNSKNKEYYFELESLKGTPRNAVAYRNIDIFFTKYKFSKEELLNNKEKLIGLIFDKSIRQASLLSVRNILTCILLFLIPFIIYFYKIRSNIHKFYYYKVLARLKLIYKVKILFFNFIYRNNITILLILLSLIIGTEIFYKYINFPALTPTESRFGTFATNDFYTEFYLRADQMSKGQKMDISVMFPNAIESSGQILPLLFLPFLLNFNPDRYISYCYYISIAIAAYIFLITLLMKRSNKEILNVALIFIIAFFLSEPGLLGIFMGNVDIILAPLLGILIYYILQFIEKKSISKSQTIYLGVLAGFILNSKITTLPLVLLSVIFSRKKVALLILIALTFIGSVYTPNLFNSESTFNSYINTINTWNEVVPLTQAYQLNHSSHIIASIFSGCLETKTCETQNTNTLIALLFFLFTCLIPIILSKPISIIKIILTGNHFHSITKVLWNKQFALVLFSFSVAYINLFFKIAYDYRLYYSIPIILILIIETQKVKNALIYCYLSMYSLLIGGLWIMQLSPGELATIDARLLKIFIIFHFIFLINSALINWKESLEHKLYLD